jgi:hypothetical protein
MRTHTTHPLARLLVVAAVAATSGHAAWAQPQRPAIADPYYAFLVEGRVLQADGRPAAGVDVERAEDARGQRPFSPGADIYRATTDARGGFRLSFSGLGLSTGRVWYLAVRRAGCAGTVATVTLRRGPAPPDGREGDVARGVVIRLPACARDHHAGG